MKSIVKLLLCFIATSLSAHIVASQQGTKKNDNQHSGAASHSDTKIKNENQQHSFVASQKKNVDVVQVIFINILQRLTGEFGSKNISSEFLGNVKNYLTHKHNEGLSIDQDDHCYNRCRENLIKNLNKQTNKDAKPKISETDKKKEEPAATFSFGFNPFASSDNSSNNMASNQNPFASTQSNSNPFAKTQSSVNEQPKATTFSFGFNPFASSDNASNNLASNQNPFAKTQSSADEKKK